MKYIKLVCLVFLFMSCQAQTEKKGKPIGNDTIATGKEIKKEEPIIFVKKFLYWYKNNYSKLNSLEIVKKNNNDNYCVDLNKSAQYLKNLNEGVFFDEQFISSLKKHIADCDKSFKENPQNDGSPRGFDYDLILLTQDIESVFNKIDNPKVIAVKIEGNKASLKIDVDMRLDFKLLYKDGWHIYEIENLGLE